MRRIKSHVAKSFILVSLIAVSSSVAQVVEPDDFCSATCHALGTDHYNALIKDGSSQRDALREGAATMQLCLDNFLFCK